MLGGSKTAKIIANAPPSEWPTKNGVSADSGHHRNRLADQSRRVMGKAGILLAVRRRHPFEKEYLWTTSQVMAYHARESGEIPDVWALDRRGDNKQRCLGHSSEVATKPPTRALRDNPDSSTRLVPILTTLLRLPWVCPRVSIDVSIKKRPSAAQLVLPGFSTALS